MAISQSKYIDITSGVGGKSAVSDRELIARVFTTNGKCGTGYKYEFTNLNDVMEYFGSSSYEYRYAAKYFGFVSKNISKAKKICFFGWSQAARSQYVKATKQCDTAVSKYVSGTCGSSLILNIGGNTHEIPGVFTTTAPASLEDLAAQIQTAVRAYTVEGTAVFPNASCSIGTDGCFLFNFGLGIEGETEAFGYTAENNASRLLKVDASSAPVLSNASPAETPAQAAARSDEFDDNYGSFFFVGSSGNIPTKAEARAVAEWNATKNYKYLYIVEAPGYTGTGGGLVGTVTEFADKTSGVGGYSGTCLWAYKSANDCIASVPAALLATTDYSRANSTKCFMYQQNDTIQAAITNNATSTTLDNLYVNYMGVTQSAGGLIKFAQDGFNMDGVDTAVYCNEVWMKSKFWTAIMNLFLSVEKVPANDDGKGMIKTVMMDTITTAIKNGTIQPMKALDVTQKVYIGQILNDPDAWKNVYTDGYVLDIVIEKVNERYIAKYILVYSKGDAIRKVEGSDILI